MPPGFADLRLAPGTTLIFHPVGGAEKNWTVENVVAPRRVFDPKRVKMQATIAGFGTPAAKRTVTLLLNGRELQSKTRGRPRERPRASRISRPRRSLRLQQRRSAHRRRRFAARRRSLLFLHRAHRSAQGSCSSTTAAVRAPNSTSAPRSIPPATADSRWKRCAPKLAASANLAKLRLRGAERSGQRSAESRKLARSTT